MDSVGMLFRFGISPKTVVKGTGPRLVPFLKTAALYFVLYPNETPETLLYCIFKILPILCLMGFVLSYSSHPEDEGSNKCYSRQLSKSSGFLSSYLTATDRTNRIIFKVSQKLDRLALGLQGQGGRYRRLILLGLVFSCIGDLFMAFDAYVVAGVAAFAGAQCCYMVAFGLFEPPRCTLLGLVCWCLSGVAYSYFYPRIPDTSLAVVGFLYVCLIFTMLWRALVRGLFPLHEPSSWTSLSGMIGAVLFVLSDLTVTYNMLCFPVPQSNLIIMSTYYAAQMAIALSMIEGHGLTANFIREPNSVGG